ncbi:ABC-2 family transporter protein, partial [Cylindrospermopsis raciborskii CS-506_A]
GLPDLLFGLIIIGYAGKNLGLGLDDYFWGILPLGCSLVILYSLWFMLGSTSIWFTKVYNTTEVLRGLLEAGRYPMSAYPMGYRVFFTFVVPVSFLTTVPAQAILGQIQVVWLISAVFLALFLFFLSTWFWRFALRFYTSASS